jgi:hypothetical protein
MPDDLTPHYRRLARITNLLPECEDSPEELTTLLAWALKSVRAIARARGLQIEPRQPEPMPRRISRELWPAQGEAGERREQPDPAGARDCHCARWPSGGPFRKNDGHFHHPDCSQAPQNRTRPVVEAGAGFAPGELARPVWGGVEEREE